MKQQRLIITVLLVLAVTAACNRTSRDEAGARYSRLPAIDASLASVPESAWIDVTGPTLIGFFPDVSNQQIDSDQNLATALDDFSYHIGMAMDSLHSEDFTVRMQSGDTLWLRTRTHRWHFVREADSSDVGYLLTDLQRRHVVIYGVRTSIDLIASAAEFRRTARAP